MTLLSTTTSLPLAASSLMDWLLGLKHASWSDTRAELGWHFAVPGWAWALIVIGAVCLAFWSYWRLLGGRFGRGFLACVRTLLVIFIAMLLAGPMFVVRDELVEPDWLLVLVDRSASMGIKDVKADSGGASGGDASGGGGARVSRNEELRRGLLQHPDLFGPDKLGRDRRVLWLGFHAGTYEIEDPVTGGVALPPAEGQSTALRSAIEQALQRAAGRPISGVVLFTDGRTHETTGADLVRALKGVNVFPVPLGSATTPLNISVARVDAPTKAFVNDIVPVTVYLDRYPADAAIDPQQITVRLIDLQTGKTLAEQNADPAGIDKPIKLTTRSDAAGPVTWRVEVEYTKPAGAPDAPDELLKEDNVAQVSLELVDRALRVLYVEGYPRWEYRYLKHVLVREKTIECSMMLVSADAAFAQEGDKPITRLPETIQELEPYDVVIIGDVPADYFSEQQIRLLRDHVSARGAGLLWIGGSQATPATYEATPLADLLPMREPAQVTPIDAAGNTLIVAPTPLAEELNILRLRPTGAAADAGLWPANLPTLQWAQDIGRLKQLAEPLAMVRMGDDRTQPLVVRLRYGAGQSVYVATDDTWRWRLGKGNLYFQQFWIQLIQMLGKARIQQNDERVYLEVSHRRAEIDQPIVVTLHVKDPLLIKRDLPHVMVTVERDEPARPIERLELLPVTAEQPEGDATTSGGEIRFEATWQPREAGQQTLRVTEAALSDLNIERSVEIVRPDDELRDPATDFPRLESIAKESGGQVVPMDKLDSLSSLVRYHTRRTVNDNREPLWDSPLALLIVVVLLTTEWIGRKMLRLV